MEMDLADGDGNDRWTGATGDRVDGSSALGGSGDDIIRVGAGLRRRR
ncbi:hypothetical protein [Streptomyces coeruleorubidus]